MVIFAPTISTISKTHGEKIWVVSIEKLDKSTTTVRPNRRNRGNSAHLTR